MERIKNLLPGHRDNSQALTPIPTNTGENNKLKPMVYRVPEIDDSPEAWEGYHKKIKRNGYAALPNCPRCKGFGVINPRNEDGKVIYEQLKTCDYAGCLVDSKARYQRGDSYLKTIGIVDSSQDFATFRQELGTKEAYAAFYWLAYPEQRNDKKLRPFLLCYGNTGNGKTHLCNAAALVLNEKKIGLRVYAVADMIADLKMAMADHLLELKMQFLKTIPALLLDDYGVNFGSEWEISKMDELLSARFRDERITILTTNLDIMSLPERIRSRFSVKDLSVIAFNTGVDQRPLKK